jgi:TRAP-type mannitol/chloroaromatic compound transport system permease small subunit
MFDAIGWLIGRFGQAFVDFFTAVTNPGLWLDWSDGEALGRFIYYGASQEFLFVFLTALILLTIAGLIWRPVMWGVVRGLEGFANALGRTVAWVGLLMVLQQMIIVFLQRIFRVSAIEIGPLSPFGYNLVPGSPSIGFDLSWWSEELKLYNAMIVCLCIGYTYVQGGHVRVDLLYAGVRWRTKRVIDALGALLFMLPAAFLTWLYAWFFMWRSLVNPKVSASESVEMILRKAKLMKWSVETIGFSPNGFNAYFLFKVLMVAFCFLVILQAVAVLFRAIAEWREGPDSENKYLDRDATGDVVSNH